jgi:aminoglycoside phosphotransferase (APT) family kinase protein
MAREGATALGRDDAALRSAARAMVGADGRGIESVSLAPSDFATLAAAEVATVTLHGGEQRRIFVKHVSGQPSHEDKRPDRELRIYRDLFADARLPVPALLGYADDGDGAGRLFLEHVGGWPVKYHPLDEWRHAVERLADLHVHFATRAERLHAADYLLRLDGEHLLRWARRARRVVGAAYPASARDLERSLSRYPEAAAVLADAPQTLVHDDLAPKNVLVDPGVEPAAIWFVDWELGGVGCGLMDLAHLKFGFPPEEDDAMVATYRAAVAGTPLQTGETELRRLLALCEAHKILYRLASSARWRLPADIVAEWAADVRRLVAAVEPASR